MRLTVMGTGYVGLVAGACFADSGHHVVCVDTDPGKVERLNRGELPIYEEGLADVVGRAAREGRLTFTTEPGPAIARAEVVFVAVGTPSGPNGEADLSAVHAVARTVARHANGFTLLVLKSTVPVGTNEDVTRLLSEEGAREVEVANNPEFLKEGVALADFRRPDRVVVGVRSERAAAMLRELYEPFVRTGAPILVMDPASAEITKYASNAMLATRISFMNDIATICDRVGADVDHVRHGVGTDKRIGPTFLFPGVGYGGSCFPKDVKSLASTAAALGVPFRLLDEVERTNERQKRVLVEKIEAAFAPAGGLAGRTIALWGLAFKPNTDDLREAPALTIIEGLVARGAKVVAHDPVAMEGASRQLAALVQAGSLRMADSPFAAVEGADALALVTDWAEYRRPDLSLLRRSLVRPWIFDGRNMWDPAAMAQQGFLYQAIGRPSVSPAPVSAESAA